MKKKKGKFTFTRPSSPRIARDEKTRRRAVSGVLTEAQLESFISRARDKGWSVKYSKPIGFKRKK